ncbi:hypothetical protein [Pseudomonas fluorescens]|nr:hypothetical protein [Pseudomonas fluorescens]
MPPVNATATAFPTVPNPNQTAMSSPDNKLSSAQVRNSSSPVYFQVLPHQVLSMNSPACLDSQAPVPPPALCANLFGSEEGMIFDQASLNKAWASIEGRLRTQPMTERDVLLTLKSGILQTPTGKALAHLFIEAIMRSIKPLAGITPERLREFADCICNIPSEHWLDTLGEDTYFPSGGLHGYIQSELTIARAHREQQITAGELLDNDTWKALRDFTQQARIFIRPASAGQLNETLSLLEDYIDVRPPQKDAKMLVDRFLRAMCKPGANELDPWGTGFATAQKLSDQINAIQTGDTAERSLHEVINATESQRATRSANAPRYFLFGSPTDSTSTQDTQNKLGISELLSLLQEIDSKASFFSEVDTTGPRYAGGLGGKLTFIANAFGTIGGEVLSAARFSKPTPLPFTAIGFPLDNAEECMNPLFHTYTGQSNIRDQNTDASGTDGLNQPSQQDGTDFIASIKPPTGTGSEETISNDPSPAPSPSPRSQPQPQPKQSQVSPRSLMEQVVGLEAEINDFIASIKSSTGTGSEETISNDPSPAPASASETVIEILEHLSQLASEVVTEIDRMLTFPGALASPPESIPFKLRNFDVEALNAQIQGEEHDPLNAPGPYATTVEPSPTWRETLAPVINQLVSQLASVLNTFGGYAVGAAASGYQLARNNPGTTATVGLIGTGGILTALGTYLTFFKEQLPEQPADDKELTNTPPREEEAPAPTQQQIDDELESDTAASVGSHSTPIAVPTTDEPKTTFDTTVTAESGEVTTPLDSTTLPQERVDEETTVVTADSMPDAEPAIVETAASHQERVDDNIERIVDTPLAKGQPPLSEAILELMYQSPDHNLLSDEHLLHEVALLLNQHTQTAPEKTYVDLILAAEADSLVQTQSPQSQTTTQSTPRHALGPIKVKREATFIAPSPPLTHWAAMFVADDVDVPASPISDEARLDQYLATMAELRSHPEVAPDLEIENDIGTADDPALSVARDVIVLLRGRRSALWADASRAAGDKELLTRYTEKVLASQEFPMTDATVVVPTHSTFGQCWQNYNKAINNPFFKEWAAKVGLELATVKVHLDTNRISGRANGHRTQFTPTDGSGWASVSGPILKAARVISPTHHTVKYPLPGGAVPIPQVADFYGEREQRDMASAQWRAKELIANEAFFQLPADDPLRPAELRSEATVKSLKQHLEDLYSLHQLVTGLKTLIQGKSDDARVKLDDYSISASPDSTFALKHPVEAQKMVTVHRYIIASGWTVPTNVAQARNLVEVLTTPVPASPETGNFWGALAYPRPLTPSQLNIITRETSHLLGSSEVRGLLEYLLEDKSFTSPAQGLMLALNSEEAGELDETVRVKLNALPTKHSKLDYTSAALLLNLDPTPGQLRNHVAGYDLTQEANLGRKPSEVVSDFEKYLVAQGKVTARTAPVAAYHLLAGSAPEYLIEVPDNLICNTHTWTMFRIAVSQIEQLSPGASLGMKFEDIMKYGALKPITVGQEIAVQSLSVNAIMDWAIANGVIVKNASDSYTPEQLKIASEKFQSVREELARAGGYLTAPVPTREALAKAELERVFGKGLPYEEPCFRGTGSPMPQPPYSMLDLYMTGLLQPGKYTSSNSEIPTATVESKLGQLKNVAHLFESEFNKYFDDLQTGLQSIIKKLIHELPIEDRQSLEYGTQTFFSVRSEAIVEELTPEVKDNHKGRHGILMVSKYGDIARVYEVFTSPPMIRPRTDLPLPLPLGGRTRTVMSPDDPGKRITIVGAMPYSVDSQAFIEGTPPRKGKISPVIIDQIYPQTLRTKLPGFGYTSDVVPNAFAPGSWASHIADVMVKEHFITGREQLRELAAGVTTWEEEQAHSASVMRFFESLIPFKTCIDNIQSGNVGDAVLDCTLDAAGFVIPGIGVAGKVAQVLKSGAKLIPKLVKVTWIISSNIVINANPLDGAGDLLKAGANVVGKLGARASSAAKDGIAQLRNLYGTSKAVDPVFVSKRADIAEGTVGAASIGAQTEKLRAVFKDGNWYDFNRATNEAYGPPLENFTPDSAIALERTTFSDGSTAYTNSQLFDHEPHTIQLISHTDVVVGDKVYRLDHEHPDVLNELSSAAYFKKAVEFEDVCSFGRITKRTGNLCFSKMVRRQNRALNRFQSISHTRLFPALPVNGGARRVVHERRIYTVADNGNTQVLIPSPLTEPLQFRLHTKGSIIDDKHFGLPDKKVDADLASKTRVVRLDGIVHGLDDQRDARAFLVSYDHQNTGIKQHLVTDIGTGLFYHCEYDPAVVDNIPFKKIDMLYKGSLGSGLIKEHDKIKDQYLIAAGVPINNDFVALPPLDSLYMDLVLKKGFTPQKIEALKAKTALLTPEKQREFVLAVWNRGNVGNVEIAAQTIKVEPIAKPSGFNLMSSADQNKIYADRAKAMVDQQFEATGLKSANQVIVNDPSDMQRQVSTRPLVIWEYTRTHAPNYADVILRTGAGNCDQMAWAAKNIVMESQGTAELWNMPGAHTFVLVGVPKGDHRQNR